MKSREEKALAACKEYDRLMNEIKRLTKVIGEGISACVDPKAYEWVGGRLRPSGERSERKLTEMLGDGDEMHEMRTRQASDRVPQALGAEHWPCRMVQSVLR